MYDLTTKSKKCDVKLTQPVKFSKWLDRHILAVVTETEVITIDSREGQPPAIPSSLPLLLPIQKEEKLHITNLTYLQHLVSPTRPFPWIHSCRRRRLLMSLLHQTLSLCSLWGSCWRLVFFPSFSLLLLPPSRSTFDVSLGLCRKGI